jgi:hypothetical protein
LPHGFNPLIGATTTGLISLCSLQKLSQHFSFEITCAGMIRATTWHEGSVIPAKAGIHPILPMDAGFRQHDGSMKETVEGCRAISFSVDGRELMNTQRSMSNRTYRNIAKPGR